MIGFDVLTEPWIPVVDGSGQIRQMGLAEAVDSADRLRRICDPSPPIEAGLYRLLVAFIMDAYELRSLDDIEAMLEARRFDSDRLRAYAKRCGHCFDLFDKDRPFLQSAGNSRGDSVTKTKPIAELAQHVPSGTFSSVFFHGLASDHAFSPAVCARLLASIAPFMTAGGAGLSPSINGIPPWYVLIRGRNLFETLLLNAACDEDRDPGVPAWRDGPVIPKKEIKRFGLLQGLTWRPRFVRLVPDKGGSCTYCGQQASTLVREMIFDPGFRAVNEEGSWIDPSAAYRITDDGLAPIRPRDGHVMWRQTGPLALLQKGTYKSEDGKLRFERPIVVSQFDVLRRRGTLGHARPLEIRCFGMRTDGKMKIFEWQTEELNISAKVMAMPDAGREVQIAMDGASWTEHVLRKALKTAYPRNGKSNEKAFDSIIAQCLHVFWRELRPLFNRHVLDALCLIDPEDIDAPQQLQQDWRDMLRKTGADALDSGLEQIDAGAGALSRQVKARDFYWRQWAKRNENNSKAGPTQKETVS